MNTNDFKIPKICKWFGHKFVETGEMIQVFVMLQSPIERCTRCRCGRVFQLGGPKLYTPEAVNLFLEQRHAVAEGKVTLITQGRAK